MNSASPCPTSKKRSDRRSPRGDGVDRIQPPVTAAFDREDEGAIAAAAAAAGWKAVRLILLGAALEIAAFAVLLLSELLKLPLTFALFAHLNAVYFFTRGFDRRLVEIHLRRELCFFFALIFPLAGMVGIVFYIMVLNRLVSRLNLSEAAAAPADAPPPDDDAAFLEDDYFSALASAFVRRVSAPLLNHEVWHRTEDTPPVGYFREKEYWRLEKDLAGKIREYEAACLPDHPGDSGLERSSAGEADRAAPAGAGPDPEKRLLLADALVEYVTLFHADPRLREHYLERARELCRGKSGVDEPAVLERLVEIAFLDGRDRECLAQCEKLRRLDAWNTGALLRQGECLFRLGEYRKLAHLAREIVGHQAVPAGLREIAQMWCQYG